MCTHDNPYPFLSAEQLADLEREARDIDARVVCESRQTPANPPTRAVLFTSILGKPKGGFEFL